MAINPDNNINDASSFLRFSMEIPAICYAHIANRTFQCFNECLGIWRRWVACARAGNNERDWERELRESEIPTSKQSVSVEPIIIHPLIRNVRPTCPLSTARRGEQNIQNRIHDFFVRLLLANSSVACWFLSQNDIVRSSQPWTQMDGFVIYWAIYLCCSLSLGTRIIRFYFKYTKILFSFEFGSCFFFHLLLSSTSFALTARRLTKIIIMKCFSFCSASPMRDPGMLGCCIRNATQCLRIRLVASKFK